MSTQTKPSNAATSVTRVEMKLEVVVIPISDVDRAKEHSPKLKSDSLNASAN